MINVGKAKIAPETDAVVSAREAAEMLGVAKVSVLRYLKDGYLRGWKKGPAWNSDVQIYVSSIREFAEKVQGRVLANVAD